MPSQLVQTLEAAGLPRGRFGDDSGSENQPPSNVIPIRPSTVQPDMSKVQESGAPRRSWLGPVILVGLGAVALYLIATAGKKEKRRALDRSASPDPDLEEIRARVEADGDEMIGEPIEAG